MVTVTSARDPQALTMTVTAVLDAPPERVWQVWADARQLERWWGPPGWPASFTAHDLTPGGESAYVMNGPDGESAGGWWRVLGVDEPRSFEFEDGFAGEDGRPDPSMPVTRGRVELHPEASGTRMQIISTFASAEQMQQLVEMGMEEGMSQALGQLDDVLAT